MLTKLIHIYKKIQNKGLMWLYKRLILEIGTSQSFIAKILIITNRFIYKICSILCMPLRLIKTRVIVSRSQQTLYLFYDLEVSPITFNFCEELAMANVYRSKCGLKYLYVIFVPGSSKGLREESQDYETIINQDARHWRKHNILIPITHLIPHCTGFTNCSSREEAELFLKQATPNIYPKNYSTTFPISTRFYEGAKTQDPNIMPIKATKQAVNYIKQWLISRQKQRKLIVITLRQYNYMTSRNSNVVAWANFANSLPVDQYFVVIIPDVEIALQPKLIQLSNFEHFLEGCWNIELRAAIYEEAYLNLGINNGPMSLCWLNKSCRYIMFKIITENVPQTTEQSLKKHGFIPNQDPPFIKPYQKWVWEPDHEEIIRREFNNMCKIIEAN